MIFTWRRFSPHAGYEVSSAGDKRFSALFARLPNGTTIEEAYQLDVKGYRAQGDDWKLGKGKPPLPGFRGDLALEYLELWAVWAQNNPALLAELRENAIEAGGILTDKFATGPVNQAWALSTILNGNHQ